MNAAVFERRVHPRRQHRTKVVFEDEFGEGLFYVYSEDISLGGIFLASDVPLQVGTLLFLSFELPGHKRPVRVTGEVVRRASSGSTPASGMGIRFAGLSEVARKRLEEFLAE
ncbi:MAG: PilZ domain-containing protein [bacterium]